MLDIPVERTINTESFIDYIHRRLNVGLSIMTKGDSCTLPVISSYKVSGTDSHGVNKYLLRLSPTKFLESYKANLSDFVLLTENMYAKLLRSADLSTPGIPALKQIEFLRDYLKERADKTSENRFSFKLSSVNFRRLMIQVEGAGGIGMMQTPLSDDASVKAVLPFFLEAQGEIDIEDVKIISPISVVDNIDLQFSIQRPSVRNRFSATFCSLPPQSERAHEQL